MTDKLMPADGSFDIVISGGGLSGTLLALSLATISKPDGSALKIAIIERNCVEQGASTQFDDRVLALSHGTAAYLHQLGLWPLLAEQAQAIRKIHVSDRGYYGKARIAAKQYQIDALGYVIEMARLGKSLISATANYSNIYWFLPDEITDISWQTSHVILTLASGQYLQAPLLLACDGAQSKCRQLANISTHTTSYQQAALIANVATANAHNDIAFERFTATGPIAMLPMTSIQGKNRSSLVWTLPPQQAQAMLALDDSNFAQTLEQAFGSWLGEITHVGQRDSFPLALTQVERQTYHRMALIGNAAHTIHPIAGQGFNLGVRDVKQFAELVQKALPAGQDIGSGQLLNHYQINRQQDQKQVIELTDSLVTLFSNELAPLVLGRNIGLKAFNYLSPLKRLLVNKAMGY